jgi:signal transduction histidine kinase
MLADARLGRWTAQGAYVAVAVTLVTLCSISLGVLVQREEHRRFAADTLHAANVLANLAGSADTGGRLSAVVRYHQQRSGGVVAVFTSGVLVTSAGVSTGAVPTVTSRRHPLVLAAFRGRLRGAATDARTGWLTAVAVSAQGPKPRAVVAMAVPLREVQQHVRQAWGMLAAVATVFLLAFTVLGHRVASWAAGTRRLIASARAWAGNNTHGSAPQPGTPRQLRQLADTLELAMRRAEALVVAHRGFALDAAHQLRAPLTVHRLRLARLEPMLPADGRIILQAIEDDVAAFAEHLEELLKVAGAMPGALDGVELDVAAIATRRLGLWSLCADAWHLELRVDGLADPALAWGSAAALEQMLDNLISNALRASPPGTTITLRILSTPTGVDVHVCDEGPGLPAAEREQAFTRWWRGEGETPSGTGLGLDLVRRIGGAYGATVTLENTPAGGMDAVIHLPREAPGPRDVVAVARRRRRSRDVAIPEGAG